jgi:hypothetical protein
MLSSAGGCLIKAAAAAGPKFAQLAAAGAAAASYHAIYDVGNSTNIKWCVQQRPRLVSMLRARMCTCLLVARYADPPVL